MATMASASDASKLDINSFYGTVAGADAGTTVNAYINTETTPNGSIVLADGGKFGYDLNYLDVTGSDGDLIIFKIGEEIVGWTGWVINAVPRELFLQLGGDDMPPSPPDDGDDGDDGSDDLPEGTVITISNGNADAGYATTVPITIENATDAVSGVTLRLWFDPEIVNVTEITKGDFPGSFTTNPFFTADGWARVVTEVGANTSLTDDRIVVANVTITAVGVAGTSCSLRLEVESLLNDSFQPIAFTSVNGMFGITANGTAKGDVNNDGEVNVGDVTYLTRYLSGWTGYPVSPEVADVTGNNVVDADDVLYLAEYVAGSPPTPVNGAVTGDMNGDGVVTSLDALMLLKAATGAITL